jgi:hypothetical protein
MDDNAPGARIDDDGDPNAAREVVSDLRANFTLSILW